jgi:hypothetical protein
MIYIKRILFLIIALIAFLMTLIAFGISFLYNVLDKRIRQEETSGYEMPQQNLPGQDNSVQETLQREMPPQGQNQQGKY